MAPRLFGKKRKDDREIDGLDWTDYVTQGASVTLALVREAAAYAPVPGLKQAAGFALQILTTIQTVKDNKSAFRLLGDETTALIAVIWRSYQTSPSQETWPSAEFALVIEDLVKTLASINEYVRIKLERGTAVRWVYSISTADSAKIDEYRGKLRHAVNKFEISCHLTIVDALQQVLSGQRQIFAQLAERGIVVERTDAERITEQIKSLKIDDRSPNHPIFPSVPQEVTSMQQSDHATRSVHVEVAVSGQEPSNVLADEVAEIVAAAERYKAKERNFLTGKPAGKRQNHETGPNSYRKATVETDEEMDDIETAVEDDWQSAPDSENSADSELEKKGRNPLPKAGKKKSVSPKSTLAAESNARNTNGAMGNTSTSMESISTGSMNGSSGNINVSMGNMSTSAGNIHSSMPGFQSPPMFQSPPPNHQFPYAPYNPYFSPPGFQHYNSSSSQSYTPFPGSPPMGPAAGYPNSGYHTPPNMFGYGNYVNNVNSGNISHTNISGVGNDNRVITYAAPPRKKNRRRRDTAGN